MALAKIPARTEVLATAPWDGDLLGTEESGKMLQRLIENLEIPYVIALHGEWGAGKTTFLRRLARSLENNNTPVIEVDAWSTDHQDDPIFAILSAAINRLEKLDSRQAYSGDLRKKIFGAGAAAIAPLSTLAGSAIDAMTATPIGSVSAVIAAIGAKYLEAHVAKSGAEEEFNASMKNARDRLVSLP
ncbi:tRNA (adenosine(37)-N6)-threonylcarbamoyltransferase complex ATPase subunit type 1 TsaE [Xanthomonas sp. NCPPB 3583]|uniref:tRNA (adenosine(37)-N6)-threonylcarbamoyltransferase complex ATPase subunit type 1 TsaE n=1 Tax=Xanthomonas sp. NCPPB 3583 TaxID=487558 RepID=UPI0035566318